MSVFTDIAAICHPMPAPGDVPEDIYNDVCHSIHAQREEMIHNLEAAADTDWEENEPLLSAIGIARYRKEQAEGEIRRLIAYGREFTRPRPYKLSDLAAASGMSVSGIRTAYGPGEVADVEQTLGRAARERRVPPTDEASDTDSAS
ncbi:hypothetical protein HET69_15665 [Streptomyces sp. CJ_13]|uniref:hypothetical protein n=1 Tax=Streptomyces sp. CJ_13 TaxID=2724943 RepID=UPI001BDC6987|nr:hypothetical protein [Streptomyces sp. CJ_13]MBT1185403.1 hypothetical protein [Streptomyces sp. CJ_13]